MLWILEEPSDLALIFFISWLLAQNMSCMVAVAGTPKQKFSRGHTRNFLLYQCPSSSTSFYMKHA